MWGKIKRVNIHFNYFSFLILFRDYPWPNGNTLRRTQAAGKLCSFPSLPHTIPNPIPIPLLPQIFQYEPLTLWRTSDLELSMTLLPKPKTSLAGRSCPKYSISSTKELVSVTVYLLKACPCPYLIAKSWIVWGNSRLIRSVNISSHK